MATMPEAVRETFERVSAVVLCTADEGAQPNGCVVAMKAVIDDQTVYLSDQFFRKTLANLTANDKVAIVFWDGEGAYQIHGTARYVNDGEEFLEQKAWVDAAFASRGVPITAKGGVFVSVEDVFEVAGGPNAGKSLL